MKTTVFALTAALALFSAPALAQDRYGPEDEGRVFSDGSRVVCRDASTVHNSRDPDRVTGTATGAVIGGLIGNRIGSSSGRKLATVGGVVAGGAIGRHVQGERQKARGQREVYRECKRVWR